MRQYIQLFLVLTALSACTTLSGPSAIKTTAGLPAGCELIKGEPAQPGAENQARSKLICGNAEAPPKIPPLQDRYASKQALLDELANRPAERAVTLDGTVLKLGFGPASNYRSNADGSVSR